MTQPLKILISAGPTQEPIDPVRYISNHSSGKMGVALAKAAIKMGHKVVMVCGPLQITPPKKATVHQVITALDMRQKIKKEASSADVIIMAAAVADYRINQPARQKLKKTKNTLTLKLIKNPDILAELGQIKKKNQILVGFAAETKNILGYAREKLIKKKCDWIVANNVARKDIGFGADDNEVYLISQHGYLPIHKCSKDSLAKKILQQILLSLKNPEKIA